MASGAPGAERAQICAESTANRLAGKKFMHNTLRPRPLDLTLDPASVIPKAMAELISRFHQGGYEALEPRSLVSGRRGS